MIFGDFNAKHRSWNCASNNKSGIQLYKLQQTNPFLIFYPNNHTHHPHSGQTPSTIDILLTNVDFQFDLYANTGHLCSDHEPVICDIPITVEHSSSNTFDYKKANWHLYRKHIDRNINTLPTFNTSLEIDRAIEQFTNLMKEARSIRMPMKTANIRLNISTETKQLIQLKNVVKRRWQRTLIEFE